MDEELRTIRKQLSFLSVAVDQLRLIKTLLAVFLAAATWAALAIAVYYTLGDVVRVAALVEYMAWGW